MADILDELRALGRAARDAARDLRDFVNTPVTGGTGTPGHGGAHNNVGSKIDRAANWITRQIKGFGGIANFLGYAQVAQDLLGRPPAHPDIGLITNPLERRSEEARRADESAQRQLRFLNYAASAISRIPGLQFIGGTVAGASMLAEFAMQHGIRNVEKAEAHARLEDFIRRNAIGNLNQTSAKRAEDLIKQYGTAENAIETLEKKKALREQGISEIENKDFVRGMRDLRAAGNSMWSNPMAIYTQMEAGRIAGKVHARTYMMRAGNRDDED